MPTPREFWDLYGDSIVSVLSIPAAGTIVVPANRDRYALTFWGTTQSVRIYPQSTDGSVSGTQTLTVNSVPIILTHALHGTLVNLAYACESTGLASSLRVVEGIMVDTLKGIRDMSDVPVPSRRPAVSVGGKIPPALLDGSVLDTPTRRPVPCRDPRDPRTVWFEGVPQIDDYTVAAWRRTALHRDTCSRRWYIVPALYTDDNTPVRDAPGGETLIIPPDGYPRGWVGWIRGTPTIAEWHVAANNRRYMMYDSRSGLYYYSHLAP